MASPVRGLRRVPFAPSPPPNSAGVRASALPPSPYTPFTGRRASTTPSSAAAQARTNANVSAAPTATATGNSYSHVNVGDAGAPGATTRTAALTAVAYARPESADAFARGGVEASLRSTCLDVVAAVQDAGGFAHEIVGALEVQISFADELVHERTAHAYARKAVATVGELLRIERETWTLILASWRSVDIRARDMCSRRAALRFEDDAGLKDGPGVEVVKRILEWLETVAGEELDRTGGPRAKPLEDPAYRWAYSCGRMAGVPSSDFPLKAPGAAGGINPLEEVEHKAEQRLSREVFRLVRAGRVEEAEELCRAAGQPWRAAALGGGRLSSDLSVAGEKGGARQIWRKAAKALATSRVATIPPHEKAVCGLLAGVLDPVLSVADGYEDRVWARLYVLLDGTIEKWMEVRGGSGIGSVKAEQGQEEQPGRVAEDEDAMMVDKESGDGLPSPIPSTKNSTPCVKFEQILEAFRESQSASDASEAVSAHILRRVRSVRSYLALGPSMPETYVDELLCELEALAQEARAESLEWACRFAVHLGVFLKRVGLVARGSPKAIASFESVVVSYAGLVIEKELAGGSAEKYGNESVPLQPLVYDVVARHLAELENIDLLVQVYTQVMASALRGDLQQEWVLMGTRPGALVRQVHDRRTICLQRAGKCFGRHGREALNRITLASVDFVWSEHLWDHSAMRDSSTLDSITGAIPGDGTEVVAQAPTVYDEIAHDDEMVVRAIEFLMFPGFGNYEEALRRVTAAGRRFFLVGKRAAARHVVEWFPSEALEQIPDGRCDNELHELDCWRAYMTAVSRHDEWRKHFFSQRPIPLPENVIAAAVSNPGQVSYEIQAAANIKMEAYAKSMENYNRLSDSTREIAIEALHVALNFDGGWMRDSSATPDNASSTFEAAQIQREREMVAIRKVAIPQLVALLHHILHESGLHEDALQLATMVADDSLSLYEDFDPTELAAFLQRIATSAVLHADSSIKGDGSASQGISRPYAGQLFEEIASK